MSLKFWVYPLKNSFPVKKKCLFYYLKKQKIQKNIRNKNNNHTTQRQSLVHSIFYQIFK